MSIEEVRKLVEAADPNALPSPLPVAVGTDETTYEVSTPNPDSVAVKDAIIKALRGPDGQPLMKVEVPSEFDNAEKPFADAMNNSVLPITDDMSKSMMGGDWAGGFKVASAAQY